MPSLPKSRPAMCLCTEVPGPGSKFGGIPTKLATCLDPIYMHRRHLRGFYLWDYWKIYGMLEICVNWNPESTCISADAMPGVFTITYNLV